MTGASQDVEAYVVAAADAIGLPIKLPDSDGNKQAGDLAARISDMETDSGDVQLSPAMKFELDQFKSDFEHNREQYRSNTAEIAKIMDELARNVCRKVNQ